MNTTISRENIQSTSETKIQHPHHLIYNNTRRTHPRMRIGASKLRIALAHHWLVGMRGGEKVLEQICQVLPHAPIYTLVAQPSKLSPILQEHPIHTSWLQRIPKGAKHYKKLLPLFPRAVSSLRVKSPVDLVLSSDASVIKGLSYSPDIPHICYCHSPPRYLWDLQQDYTMSSEAGGPMGRAVFNGVAPYVREFDRKAASRVTHFIANSNFVRDRILAYYGRKSEVIHPPVYLDEFEVSSNPPDNFYLIVSQLVPYKRVDLAVAAFNKLKKNLVIVGDGSERGRLEEMAGPSISFLGSQPQWILRDFYRRCQALVFPGIEDFGITPLEAQASGRPVLAYRVGGALETIQENTTGLFFNEQTVESLVEVVEKFETLKKEFNPVDCRSNANKFGADRFRANLSDYFTRLSLRL
jgi:glycosyltransferase involved in cell wall biosynthesis